MTAEGLLEEMADVIAKTVSPERIYLFGSRARGDFREDSDYDLLVVASHDFGPEQTRMSELSRIRRALAPFRVPKDILVYTSAEMDYWRDSRNHVIGDCLAEGRLIYARPQGRQHVPGSIA